MQQLTIKNYMNLKKGSKIMIQKKRATVVRFENDGKGILFEFDEAKGWFGSADFSYMDPKYHGISVVKF